MPTSHHSNHKNESVKMTLNQYLLQMGNTGNYFVFNRNFIKVLKLGKSEALFLQDVINLASMESTVYGEDGYFLCMSSFLEKSLDWCKATQKRMFISLQEREYVRVRHENKTNKRYVYVDMEKICTDLGMMVTCTDRPKKSPPLAQNEPLLSNTYERRNPPIPPQPHPAPAGPSAPGGFISPQSLNLSRPRRGKTPVPKDPVPQRYTQAAQKAKRAFFDRNLCFRGTVEKWGAVFMDLDTKEGQKDWEDVLDWYCENLSEERIEEHNLPTASGPNHFRSVFQWIKTRHRKAKKRQEQKKREDLFW